jgi:proteasome lid subunit RPN8/RPN11
MNQLKTRQEILRQRLTRLLAALSRATISGNDRSMTRIFRELRKTNEFLGALRQIQAELAPEVSPAQGRYVVSSYFLHEAYKLLTADRFEQFCFITGSEINGLLVLDQRIEFQHTKRNEVAVVGEMSSTHKLLIKLEQFGHRLLGHFHSHPGTGPSATMPSGTDENFQRRLESAGYPAVAAIFSRDGYVRFFRLDNNLTIEIHGTGVEDLGQNTYRLRHIDAH